MRYVVAMLHVVAKLAALGLLPILVLGYLFFLSCHTVLTHLYVAATLLGLAITIAVPSRAFQSATLRSIHGMVALAATVLGCLKVREHLMFFEGPKVGAAGLVVIGILAILVGFFNAGSQLNTEGEGSDV